MSATTVLTMVDGVRVVVTDTLDQITPYVLREQQDWFEDEIRFLRRMLQPGQHVIDIGANHGVYTLSMAKAVGPGGKVWAFEPASSTAHYLATSIEANHFRHVVLDRSALSNRVGTAALSLHGNSELNSLGGDSAAGGRSEDVAVITLDECMKRFDWTRIDFVKIDAEGEELNILAGGEQFLAIQSPLIMYEIKAAANLSLELVQAFASQGYSSYRLVPGLGLLVPFDAALPADGFLLNLFACKPDRAAKLAATGHLLEQVASVDAMNDHAQRSPAAIAPGGHESLMSLPYARLLAPVWDQAAASGRSVEITAALALYAQSQNRQLGAPERFRALDASFETIKSVCARGPGFLRLATLARIAQDHGARSIAVAALQQLCSDILQRKQFDPREPFLLPWAGFDKLPVEGPVGNWVLAAGLEALERLSHFSSIYALAAAEPRLESLAALGHLSMDMKRRLELIRERRSRARATAGTVGDAHWSLLEWMPAALRLDILDIGAALGEQPSYQPLLDAGRARLIGFEPNVAECERLERHYGEPHRFYPHFVGDGQLATFHETNRSATSSLLAPNTPLLEKFQNLAEVVTLVATHAVSTVRIDDLAELGNVDFIKIDVQGAELAVLRNGVRALSKALVVQTEVEFVELYRGQPLFADVDAFLRSQGFVFHAFVGICGRAFKPMIYNDDVNAPARQALWSDAFYVRDWMRLDELDATQLQKYAVLAHHVLKSFDLAHLVLKALDQRVAGNLAGRYLERVAKPQARVPG